MKKHKGQKKGSNATRQRSRAVDIGVKRLQGEKVKKKECPLQIPNNAPVRFVFSFSSIRPHSHKNCADIEPESVVFES